MQVIRRSISMQGFVVSNLYPKFATSFFAEMPVKVVSGEIQYREHVYDLAHTGEAILAVLKGHNTAKVVIHVADE